MAVLPPPVTPSSRIGVGSWPSTAARTRRRAVRLGIREAAARRPGAADACGPAGHRPSRPLADLRAEQATPHEPGDRRRPVALRERPGGQAVRGGAGPRLIDLEQRGLLAGAERSPGHALPATERRGGRPPLVGGPQPALVARSGRRGQQGPCQLDHPVVGQGAQPPQEPGAALGCRELPHGPGPSGELVDEVELHAVQARVLEREPRLPRRRHLDDELEALQHPGREHRPDGRRERREVSVGDPGRQLQRQRAAAADRRSAPSRRSASAPRRRRRSHPAPRPPRSPGARPARTGRARPRRSRSRRAPPGRRTCTSVAPGRRGRRRPPRPASAPRPAHPGAPASTPRQPRPAQVIRIRRSPLRRFSCAMIASISAAVRPTSPVSLTTTWS